MGSSKQLFKYKLIHNGKPIAIEIAENIPKFMKKMKRRGGCTVSITPATAEEIKEYLIFKEGRNNA